MRAQRSHVQPGELGYSPGKMAQENKLRPGSQRGAACTAPRAAEAATGGGDGDRGAAKHGTAVGTAAGAAAAATRTGCGRGSTGRPEGRPPWRGAGSGTSNGTAARVTRYVWMACAARS
eukprot:6264110-Amphidinium_carterae.1